MLNSDSGISTKQGRVPVCIFQPRSDLGEWHFTADIVTETAEGSG